MSSNLKVNNILPSTGTTVAVSGIVSATSSVSIGSSCTATTFYGALTGTASGNPTLTDGANNRVVTATGANTLTGETGLTYDTQALRLNNTAANPQFHLTSADNGISELKFGDQSDLTRAVILYRSGSAGDALCFNGYNNSERLRILSDGKVGIGTDTATAKLEITDAIGTTGEEVLLKLQGRATKNVYLDINADANRRGVIRFKSAGTDKWSIGRGDSDEISDSTFFIATGNSGGNTAKLAITSSGVARFINPTGELKIASSTSNDGGKIILQENTLGAWSLEAQRANGFFKISDEYNNADRFNIDSNGYIYEPAMPFGVLHGSTGWTYNSNGHGHYLLGNTNSSSGGGNGSDRQLNIGWTTSGGNGATNNNFAPSNGIWTAPIAGYYVFGLKLYGLMNSNDYIQIKPCLNGTHLSETIYGYQQGNGMYMEGINETVRYYMEANDTFSWNAYGTNNAWRIYGAHCETSGYLVRGA